MRKTILFVKLVSYVVLPLVLLLLPASYFDTGQSVCLSVRLFDQECYACGMTSAIMHFIHLDFEMAYAYNALSFLVAPVIAFGWAKSFYDDWKAWKAFDNAAPAAKS
jgi:hypothetical protein